MLLCQFTQIIVFRIGIKNEQQGRYDHTDPGSYFARTQKC